MNGGPAWAGNGVGKGRSLNTTYEFRLPGVTIDLCPVLRVDGEVPRRTYILLFDLPEDPSLALDDPSLTWSESLHHFYRYAPETRSAGVVRTPPLTVPADAGTLRIRVHRWKAETPSTIADIVLSASMAGEPAIIFPEGA